MSEFIYQLEENGRRYRYYLLHEGAGGFLNPPGDAEHIYSIRENKSGYYSLRGALESEWIPERVKSQIRQILRRHKAEMTEEWVQSVYAYFHHCYAPENLDRNVSNCIVDKENSLPPERHLAYLHIKSFFPDVGPRLDLIKNPPKWGK